MAKKYIVYGASWCNFCKKAIALLDLNGLEYHFLDAAEDRSLLKEIKDFYKSSTVPVIVSIDKQSGLVSKIGGFTDLERVLSKQ